MRLFRTTGVAAGLIAAGTLIGASLSTFASVFDWSTTPATNATADPNINWAEGMLPSSVNDSARATMAAIAAYIKDAPIVTGGTGNAYTLTLTQPMASWTPGLFTFRVDRTNTGATSLSINGLTAKPMRPVHLTEFSSGQLIASAIYYGSYVPATDEVIVGGLFFFNPGNFLPFTANSTMANLTGSPAAPANVSLASFFAAAPTASIPPSAINVQGYSTEVRWFNTSTCPTGWIAADGTSGSPDLRGAFIRGMDNGRGLDAGRTLASFQADALASHTHSITDPGHSHTIPENFLAQGPTASIAVPTATTPTTTASTNSATTGITINATGGNETRPRNVALLACYHT